MERMLVTQALDERDLLKKRISDSIRRLKVVETAKSNDTKVSDGTSIKDFTDKAKSQYQSIMDLIDRYERLDSSILLANATEKVDIAGKIMTRASAINLRKSLLGTSRTAQSSDFRGMLISRLNDEIRDVKQSIGKLQSMADKQREIMISNISSADKKDLTQDTLDGVDTYCSNLVSKMIDPINAQEKLDNLTEERDTIIKNIESAIKISNATTYVEF